MPLNEGSGHLLENIVLFGRYLRALGVAVDPGGAREFIQALDWIDIGNGADFFFATRALFVTHSEDLPVFEEAFKRFWGTRRNLTAPSVSAVRNPYRRSSQGLAISAPSGTRLDQKSRAAKAPENNENLPEGIHVELTYSPIEMLRQKDFGELTTEELEQVKRLIAQLAWRLGERQVRRWRLGDAEWIDFRRTIRSSLRYGGEIPRLWRREHRTRPRPLVVIADISGSMERYSSLLLLFIFGLAKSMDHWLEAFVFSTQLTRITRRLRGRDPARALQEVSHGVPDWSGGTRIGAALKTFNFEWARRVLGRGAVVLLISDGWDRGEIDLLGQEMARLQRSSYRLIWLNPLLGSSRYEPLTRGMQAALPYVDDFLAVHNLDSLEQLTRHLEQLDERRPVRSQARLAKAAGLGISVR